MSRIKLTVCAGLAVLSLGLFSNAASADEPATAAPTVPRSRSARIVRPRVSVREGVVTPRRYYPPLYGKYRYSYPLIGYPYHGGGFYAPGGVQYYAW